VPQGYRQALPCYLFWRSGWNIFDFAGVAVALVPALGPWAGSPDSSEQILKRLEPDLKALLARMPSMRMSVAEPGMFKQTKETTIKRGSFVSLFTCRKRLVKCLWCILIGVLVTFSPEFAKAFGVTAPIKANYAVISCYCGPSATIRSAFSASGSVRANAWSQSFWR